MKRAIERVWSGLRSAGPYLLVELLLPGGTLVALFLWLSSGTARGQLATVPAAATSPVALERVITPQVLGWANQRQPN